MEERQRKWFLFVLMGLVLMYSAGLVMYGGRPDETGAFRTMVNAASFQSTGGFYGRLVPYGETFSLVYASGNGTESWCIGSEPRGIVLLAPEMCDGSKRVVFDGHAASSLVMSAYHARGIALSEFLTGHLKVEGFSPLDAVGWG